MFDGKGKYEEPKLVWAQSTGLTSLIFLDSDKLETLSIFSANCAFFHFSTIEVTKNLYDYKRHNSRNKKVIKVVLLTQKTYLM